MPRGTRFSNFTGSTSMPPVKFARKHVLETCLEAHRPSNPQHTFGRANHTRATSESTNPFLSYLDSRNTTVGTSHKAQTIGTTRHLCALCPPVHSASYRPGRATKHLDMNFLCGRSHEASIGPIDAYMVAGFPCNPRDWVLA